MTKKYLLIIGIGVLSVIIITTLIYFLILSNPREKDDKSDSQVNPQIDTQQKDSSAETESNLSQITFTQDIFDVNRVDYITPLGDLHGGYEEISAIAGVMIDLVIPENGSTPEPMDIYAPTDMSLESYAYYKMSEEEGVEWSLSFRISDDVTMQLWHIDTPVQRIREAAVSEPKQDSRTESPKHTVEFRAGEKIAETVGTNKANNWNILVNDQTHENKFVNQARYEANYLGQRLITARCPFDFYPKEEAEKYLSLVGYNSQDGAKTGMINTCGSVSRDVKGTIAGIWHFSSESEDGVIIDKDGVFTTPLAIYETISGSITIDMIDGKTRTIFESSDTYKDPATITSLHCYELEDIFNHNPVGYIFFKLASDTEMKISYSSSGSCPSVFPNENIRTYYR